MSQTRTPRTEDGETLRNSRLISAAVDAGASGAFVRALAHETPPDRSNLARRKCIQHADFLEAGEKPPFGGCMSALWDGDVRRAWARADLLSRTLMVGCGVALDADGVDP